MSKMDKNYDNSFMMQKKKRKALPQLTLDFIMYLTQN